MKPGRSSTSTSDTPNHDRDVVGPTVAERVLQKILTDLLRRGHRAKSFFDLFVGDVLGEPIAAQQTNATPSLIDARDHNTIFDAH